MLAVTTEQIAELKAELKEIRARVERLTIAVVILAFISGGVEAIKSVIAF